MRNGSERKPAWSSPPPYCEVGLGLKMQQQSSYSCEGGGGGGSGSPFFNNQPHVYELANGCGNMCGKSLFTTSQLQELERQKLIHKYILASIPVPPQLLLTTSPTQCNTAGGLDLRFSSNGSDPEPWRCKRTDGKKWRCSRDVAPDQKYCERHAHKNRPRSRKHVENSPHKQHLSNNPTTLRRSVAAPYDQTRCMEWLMRGGKSDDTKQWEQQQLMQISRDNTSKSSEDDHDLSVYHPHFADKQQQQDFSSDATQTTRLFIDAWGKEEERTDKKSWPLSLSMKTEWWGGPLGEALCLGNASTTHSAPHRYTKTSSDDANHALNFIG